VLDPATRRWVLKVKGDANSGESEEIRHNQRVKWQGLKDEIQENIKSMTIAHAAGPAPGTKPWQAMPWAPPPQANTGGPSAAGPPADDTTSQDVLGVLRNLYSMHGAITEKFVMQLLEREKSRTGSRIANLPLEVIRVHLMSFVVRICDSATILRKWDDPLVDEYRPVMIEYFRKHPSGTREEIQAYVRKNYQDKEIPDKVFWKVSTELAEYKANEAKWTLKSGPHGEAGAPPVCVTSSGASQGAECRPPRDIGIKQNTKQEDYVSPSFY